MKLPKLAHVKFVRRAGRIYAYFNTGETKPNGQPLLRRLPPFGSVGFWDSYAAFCAGRTKRAAPEYTVANLADDYLRSADYSNKADNTQRLYANQLKKVRKVWRGMPVNDLTPREVRAALEAEGWGGGTRYMVVAVLGVIYRWGRRNDLTHIDPVQDIERPKIGEHDPWPDDVVEAALKAEDAVVRLAVHLLYFTGQRIGDVMKMRWSDIRDGRIWVKQSKTGKIVEPPLMSELKAELSRHPKGFETIIHGIGQRHLRTRLQSFTRALGTETVPHGLRKNAVNALLEAGCTIAEVASITGQTHQIVEKYAAKVNRRKLGAAAIVKLEAARKR